MNWNTYLVFPQGTQDFDPRTVPWYERPAPIKIMSIGNFKDMTGKRVYCSKEYSLENFPNIGKLLAGSVQYHTNEDEIGRDFEKTVTSVTVLKQALSRIKMMFHRLNVNGTYTAVAVTYSDGQYSYPNTIRKDGNSYWKPSPTDRNGMISVSLGNLSSLSSFKYQETDLRDEELDIFHEMSSLDSFLTDGLSDLLEFETLSDDYGIVEDSSDEVISSLEQMTTQINKISSSVMNIDNAVKNLDVSGFDTSELSELITECNNGIVESLRKSTEQSSKLDAIIEKVDNQNIEFQSFSAQLSNINEFYGTRIFEIEQLKAELSSFYDKAIAAWKESIESISESLTASAHAGSVALDINQALDSLKSNLKRVETLASIFDKASTVSGEISTNAQIVGTAVSTLSSLLLSFNNSVDGYEKTLLSLVENVRQNLDLFLHSSDSVFKEARRAVSDSVVTNALSKGLDLINSIKKKETL